MLGKRSCRWHGEKSKEAIQIIGRSWNQFAIPLHHIGGFAQLVQHRTAINGIDRMELECERSNNPEISAATTNRPKQVGVLVAIRFHKFSVRQDDIGRKQIINR